MWILGNIVCNRSKLGSGMPMYPFRKYIKYKTLIFVNVGYIDYIAHCVLKKEYNKESICFFVGKWEYGLMKGFFSIFWWESSHLLCKFNSCQRRNFPWRHDFLLNKPFSGLFPATVLATAAATNPSLHSIFAPCPALFSISHQQMHFCSIPIFSHNKAKKRTTWFPK